MNEEPKKTKYLLKAQIKLHPKIQKKIDEGTNIFAGIMIALLLIGLGYLLINTLIIQHPESITPTQKEIDKICNDKNMESYGYTIENNAKGIISINQTTQIYITCKTPYPTTKQVIDKTEYCSKE